MNIILKKDTAEGIGLKTLTAFGARDLGWGLNEKREIDLQVLSTKRLEELSTLLKQHTKLRGVQTALHNIKVWQKAMKGEANQVARDAFQMSTLMKASLKDVPGHRLYYQDDDLWWPYYLDNIEYVPKRENSNGITPAHIILYLLYQEFGERHIEKLLLWNADLMHKTPLDVLATRKYFVETEEMRAEYLEQRARYITLQPKIGHQLHVWGVGVPDLDELGGDDDNGWHWRTPPAVAIGSQDEPGRAVIDVFYENPKKRDRDNIWINRDYWGKKVTASKLEGHDDIDDVEDDDENEGEDLPTIIMPNENDIEIPIHLNLAIYDLKKHVRLRLHVQNVESHVYDTTLADKLVLRDELKQLVALLIEHKSGGFQDIVGGKSGGAVILLCGKPGTGKTLTAEVYAETEQRALYSVQCSQLGITPEDLEKELMKCFVRNSRWNSVMLLDEADVYVRQRGDDLNQNAIVGVFLRVLEYQSAVLFLTTNRADDVDDAVASRCIAKLTYEYPDEADQHKIWQILAEASKMELALTERKMIVHKMAREGEKLSGRDIKNLLKLGGLMSKGKPITAKIIEYVKQFKPTK
jgi:hypothetical protein